MKLRQRSRKVWECSILLAACAAGLALARYYVAEEGRMFSSREHWQTWTVAIVGGQILAVSATVLVLSATRPRPPRAGCRCGPGRIACAVVVLTAAIETAVYAPKWSKVTIPAGVNWWNWLATVMFAGSYAPVIVVAWGTLVLTGRWRPKPGLLDRLGRFVGYGCLAMFWGFWLWHFAM